MLNMCYYFIIQLGINVIIANIFIIYEWFCHLSMFEIPVLFPSAPNLNDDFAR